VDQNGPLTISKALEGVVKKTIRITKNGGGIPVEGERLRFFTKSRGGRQRSKKDAVTWGTRKKDNLRNPLQFQEPGFAGKADLGKASS